MTVLVSQSVSEDDEEEGQEQDTQRDCKLFS